MKYAVISDIHGNLPALKAVLDDAKKCGVDQYIFAGDYYEALPYPNEVVNTIKSFSNAYVISGNKENYLHDLSKQDQSTWVYEHMAPLYWNYQNLSDENLDYLMNLPKELTISKDCLYVRMFHSMEYLFRNTKIKELNSMEYASKMKANPFTHEDYLRYMGGLLASDEDLKAIIRSNPAGAYIFGHTHIQWHAYIGRSLLINPGSCGFPLDFNTDAPYTILEYDGCSWSVEERRVPYNVEDTIVRLKDSELYRQAKIWSDVMIRQLRTGENMITGFLKFAKQLAIEMDSDALPYYSNEIWRLAASRWFGN